jgi:aspartyl-tRNA(Asn)/glutamyl-tRNA(Gln) amidotransferase subunit A
VAALEATGATVFEVVIPHYDALTAAAMYGFFCEGFAYHDRDLQTRWFDYGGPTRRALANGAMISGGDYVQAQRVRRVGMEAMLQLFTTCDVVVTATASRGAPAIDTLSLSGVMDNVLTPVWNAVGFPALSVPMGFTADGLPLGLQIAARPFEDAVALDVGMAYQTQTDWHLRRPAMATLAPA